MADQHASDLPAITLPIVDTDVVIMSRDGTQLHKVPVSDLQAYVDSKGSGNVVQNRTQAQVVTAIDFTAGNIVNVTDNLPSGITLLAEPTMPAGVKVGDRFELFFNKLLATQCTVQLPSTPSNLSYPFNNGTQAHIAFEWSGTRLVEV